MILPSMLLIGAACALTFPSLNIQATNSVHDDEQGMVSGLLNTAFQVGGALFPAVVTAVVTAEQSGGSAQEVLDSFRPGLAVVTAVAVAGLVVTLSGLRVGRRRSLVVASSVTDEAAEPATAARATRD